MRRPITLLLAAAAVAPSACSTAERATPEHAAPAVESVYTDLRGPSCREEIDRSDPNETPYTACPGVGGYTLIVRRAEAGRRSIDVVDPGRRVFPLDYPRSVTPHMSALGARAEWRVRTTERGRVPIALVVPVEAHEDAGNPETVTRTWLAVARIAPDTACVVGRIVDRERSEDEVRTMADSAQGRPCIPSR